MKRFTGFVLALFTFVFVTSSFADTPTVTSSIAGTVYDQRNLPAQFVYVSLIKLNENSETIFQKIVSTNAEGKFEFNNIEILSTDITKIGAYIPNLNTDVSSTNNNHVDVEVRDIGAYANDVKGVVETVVINTAIDFISVSSNIDNSHLILHLAMASPPGNGRGNTIRPNHGEIGTYPSPGPNSGNRIRLYQNFPNPFNPQTKIVYSVLEQSLVTLKVYDLSGKELKELVNETKAPGNYEVVFNASNLSSGFYIYKITAGNEVMINKMSLIK